MYGRKGGFMEGFADRLNVCMDTLTEWRKVHPEFSSAYKKAKQAQLMSLLKSSRKAGLGQVRGAQPALLIFLLKACHGLNEGGPMDQDEGELEFED